MLKDKAVRAIAGRTLVAGEVEQVSGGVEPENLYPHKPGGVEVAVYVDGTFWGTATVNRNDPLGPGNPSGYPVPRTDPPSYPR